MAGKSKTKPQTKTGKKGQTKPKMKTFSAAAPNPPGGKPVSGNWGGGVGRANAAGNWGGGVG
jgi:hypothetical protein